MSDTFEQLASQAAAVHASPCRDAASRAYQRQVHVFLVAVAHELTNSVGAIVLATDLAAGHFGDSETLSEAIAAIREQTKRCERLAGIVVDANHSKNSKKAELDGTR